MAPKQKISDTSKERFARKERQRKQNNRLERKYYLIVCEGEKTEPNYFKSFAQDLPKGMLTTEIFIEGTGRNTQSLVKEALRLKDVYEKDKLRSIEKLWTVFDRDSFTPKAFNDAINYCNQNDIGCAWSNEAFELWFLLHFDYIDSAISRKEYQRMIEERLRPYLDKKFKYKKNDPNMYFWLKQHGSIKKALANAKKLDTANKGKTNFANQNPCTKVWVLVEEFSKIGNMTQ